MKKPKPAKPANFEDALAKLESIVQQLEEGQLGLDESLTRYEQGVKCLRKCHGLLERAERKIELLLDVDSQGGEVTEPFEEDSMSLPEKADARSRRRSAKSRPSSQEPDDTPADDASDVPGELF